MISVEGDKCTVPEEAARREWLETNGIGGFATSTVAGINTRRYHGLLVAATDPPLGRMVLLSKLEETLIVGGERFALSANYYPDAVHPDGFRHLVSFRLDPFPVWKYVAGGIVLEKKLFMRHGENTVVCTWEIVDAPESIGEATLEVLPLLAYRDYHSLRSEGSGFDGSFEALGSDIKIRADAGAPVLNIACEQAEVRQTGHWYRNFQYPVERDRGFDHSEDLYQPFSLEFDLSRKGILVASTGTADPSLVPELEMAEIRRRDELAALASAKTENARSLVNAADQFIVKRGSGHTVIAGYPWFSDWGRDTMIALPGLTISTGRTDIARDILLEFSNHISEGMLPNRFPDAGEEPEYNTVDATLWYFEAVRAYVSATGDRELVVGHLYEKLASIIDWHIEGTRYGIRLDGDGLLEAGVEGQQLTWMDARIEDWVVTPRIGKPVEIQALWYNALKIMEGFAADCGDPAGAKKYKGLAAKAKESFRGRFWNEARGCLYDVVSDGYRDGRIRPNQIFAASLTHSMLGKEDAAAVVKIVGEQLLTPFGLRSLSSDDPDYRPVYKGGPVERDSAYHQGTIWPWLIGAYVDAYRRVRPKTAKTDREVEAILAPMYGHLSEAGLGQVSEIFDAEAPFEPRGCFAQAWSVAELLRVMPAASGRVKDGNHSTAKKAGTSGS